MNCNVKLITYSTKSLQSQAVKLVKSQPPLTCMKKYVYYKTNLVQLFNRNPHLIKLLQLQ